MRIVAIDKLEKGCRLAQPIYGEDGRVLLRKGVILSSELISRLKQLELDVVHLEDETADEQSIERMISRETREKAINCIRQVTEQLKANKSIDLANVKATVDDIIDEIMVNKDMMISLSDIRSYDDYTFTHSVNVTVMALLIGTNLYYTKEQLREMGVGVILHDVGKIKIPAEILNKPGKLEEAEFDLVKQHTWQGFEMLRHEPGIKITSAHVALQHHECVNGLGYPRGLKGKEISEYARIAAIADVYDALSTDRCYRKKMPPERVCEILLTGAGTHFDARILDRFIQKVALYPQGTKVLLSDGRSGLVVKQNTLVNDRPIVRVFWDCEGKDTVQPEDINLLYEDNISIEQVL